MASTITAAQIGEGDTVRRLVDLRNPREVAVNQLVHGVEVHRVAPTRLNRGATHLMYVTVIDGLGFKRVLIAHPDERVEIDEDAS